MSELSSFISRYVLYHICFILSMAALIISYLEKKKPPAMLRVKRCHGVGVGLGRIRR